MKIINRISLIVAMALVLIVYSTALFMFADMGNGMLWVGYGCTIFAFLAVAAAMYFCLADPWDPKDMFYQIPVVQVGIGYLAVVMILGAVSGLFAGAGIKVLILLELAIHVIGLILLAIAVLNMHKIVTMQAEKDSKVADMRLMSSQVKELAGMAADAGLASKLNRLAEDIRFSDPMSDEQVAVLDRELYQEIQTLQDMVSDDQTAQALAQVQQLTLKLQERNRQCKIAHGKR